MKLRIFTLIIISFAMMSNKGGRNQPASGAPGDGPFTCAQCHGGGSFTPMASIILTNVAGDTVSNYIGGQTYTVELQGAVEMNEDAKGYGFQFVALDNANNEQAGTFFDFGPNVRNNIVSERNYIMQSAPRTDGKFTTMWTAPDISTDSVTFYTSLLAINGNNNTNGDKVISTSFTFGENVVSGINNTILEELNISPNPTHDLINVNVDTDKISIYSITGQLMTYIKVNQNTIDIGNLSKGVYIIQVDGYKAKRVIKL
jgi:hypothetical protein